MWVHFALIHPVFSELLYFFSECWLKLIKCPITKIHLLFPFFSACMTRLRLKNQNTQIWV